MFLDPFVCLADEEVVGGEVRATVMGFSERWNVLCVVYAVRLGKRFRIIPARFSASLPGRLLMQCHSVRTLYDT